jgi:hypothetical protein
MNTLIAQWAEGKVPILNGVIEASGRVHLVRAIDPPRSLPLALPLEQEVDFALLPEAAWTSALPFEKVIDPAAKIIAVVGECGMGSDGFVAVQAADQPQSLLWLAFFDFSNPFESVRFDGGLLKATNNLNEEWSFALSAPWQVEIRRAS